MVCFVVSSLFSGLVVFAVVASFVCVCVGFCLAFGLCHLEASPLLWLDYKPLQNRDWVFTFGLYNLVPSMLYSIHIILVY